MHLAVTETKDDVGDCRCRYETMPADIATARIRMESFIFAAAEIGWLARRWL